MKSNVLLLLLFALSFSVRAQVIGSMINAKQERARISLVDEFMKRFNGIEDRLDVTSQAQDYALKRYLVLFNGKLFKAFGDSTYIAATDFIKQVNKDSTQLHYSDTTWIAKVKCHGKFSKQDVSFTMYLSVEARSKADMFKWVINKVEGNLFKLNPSSASDGIMISPDSHETKFMSLSHITTGKDDYITNYMYKGHKVDQTSVFLSYVYSGMLEIEYVDDIEFIFYQVPNYVFSIKEFNRKSYNDGWLISSFRKMSEEDKIKELKSLRE